MKKLFAFFVFFGLLGPLYLSASAQTEKKGEYLILTVHHYLKRDGLDARLSVNIGTGKDHSLYGIVENADAGAVSFRIDNKLIICRNEVDFLEIALSFGFQLIDVKEIKLSGKTYLQYLFFKQN